MNSTIYKNSEIFQKNKNYLNSNKEAALNNKVNFKRFKKLIRWPKPGEFFLAPKEDPDRSSKRL